MSTSWAQFFHKGYGLRAFKNRQYIPYSPFHKLKNSDMGDQILKFTINMGFQDFFVPSLKKEFFEWMF